MALWRQLREEDIKIGEEGEAALTEEVKDLYRRLAFAYYEIAAENPKKPGIIPGIYHRILLKDDTRPCRERVRGGAPGEELTKDEEVKMLLKNDIVEECNSEWSSNLVIVRKKDGTCTTYPRGLEKGEHGDALRLLSVSKDRRVAGCTGRG